MKGFKDMFDWEFSDMIGLDPIFLTHNFVVQEGKNLVQ